MTYSLKESWNLHFESDSAPKPDQSQETNQMSSGTILMAPQGQSETQIPQPLQ
jgi:hypothetical protein